MSTKKVAHSPFLERLFRLISEEAKGKPTLFAKMAGIPHSTFYGYLEGKIPDPKYLIRIHDVFHVNIDWLVSGTGEPYVSLKQQQEQKQELRESNTIYMSSRSQDKPADLSELVGMAIKVLTSENKMASEALEKNIRYFAYAIEVEKRLENVEARLGVLEKSLKKAEPEGSSEDEEPPSGEQAI